MRIFLWKFGENGLYCSIAETEEAAREELWKRFPRMSEEDRKIVEGKPYIARKAPFAFQISDRSAGSLV